MSVLSSPKSLMKIRTGQGHILYLEGVEDLCCFDFFWLSWCLGNLLRVQLSVKLRAETSWTGPSFPTCLVPQIKYILCLRKLRTGEKRVLEADHKADRANYHNARLPGRSLEVTDPYSLLFLALLTTLWHGYSTGFVPGAVRRNPQPSLTCSTVPACQWDRLSWSLTVPQRFSLVQQSIV